MSQVSVTSSALLDVCLHKMTLLRDQSNIDLKKLKLLVKYTIYTQRWCGLCLFGGIFNLNPGSIYLFLQTCPLLVFAAMGKLFIYLKVKSEFNLQYTQYPLNGFSNTLLCPCSSVQLLKNNFAVSLPIQLVILWTSTLHYISISSFIFVGHLCILKWVGYETIPL